MALLIRVALLAILCGSVVAEAKTGDRLDRAMLRLTFVETFDAPPAIYDAATHRGTWKTNWFYGDQKGPSSRIAGEDVYVDPAYSGIDPFTMSGGRMAIVLARNAAPDDPRSAGARFTTGLLTTECSFKQRYGYFEAKMTMPGVSGTWPAFWLYSAPIDSWVGGLDDEIDVVEGQGATPSETLHSVHRRHAWSSAQGGDRKSAVFDTSFRRDLVDTRTAHVYGVLWTRDAIVWYIDDREVARMDNPGMHSEMYVLLSMGSGGWEANVITSDFRSARLRLDFVRVHALRRTALEMP